ncbi:MAG TPA: zinc ribbon domain-containing protein [Ktedonobacterales bacterium]|nr:zinc ribbon domain-containing protein [Ktedonobacterales bacterium]
MQDFVEAAKRLATQATDRATWEANRMRRVTASQHEVELAQRERTALLEQLAGVALDLERRSQLTQEPLLGLVRRLKAVDQEITRGAAQVQAIRAEAYQPGASAPGPVPARGQSLTTREYPCPTCKQPVRDTAAFCSACGARLR